MSDFINIQSSAEIRREQLLAVTQHELNFWKAKAEDLQYTIEKIFETAEQDGQVSLVYRSRKIELVLPSPTPTEDAGK